MENENSHPPPILDRVKQPTGRTNGGMRVRRVDEKFCESCGEIIRKNIQVCSYCGYRFRASEAGMGGFASCLVIGAVVTVVSMVGIALIGILAAIAIPNFIAYRDKANMEIVRIDLENLIAAEQEYYLDNRTYTDDIYDLDFVSGTMVELEIISADENCFEAKGEHVNTGQEMWADCDGIKEENSEYY